MELQAVRIAMVLAVFLAAPSSFGDAPLYIPFSKLIESAEAVALVEVTKIEAIPQPEHHDTSWTPNQTVTVKVLETWRGQLPAQFMVGIRIEDKARQKIVVGDRVVLFSGAVTGEIPKQPEGHVGIYQAAQGFRPLKFIIEKGGDEVRKTALNALASSVKAYRKPERRHPGLYPIRLNDEATAPLLDLFDKDVELRVLACSALESVEITQTMGDRLIAELSNGSEGAQRSAAQLLAAGQYAPAADTLQKLLDNLPHDKGAELLKPLLARYFAALAFQKHLGKIEPNVRAAILRSLEKLPEGQLTQRAYYLMDAKGRLSISTYATGSGTNDFDVQLLQFLEKMDPLPKDQLPLRITIEMQRDGESFKSYVRVTPGL